MSHDDKLRWVIASALAANALAALFYPEQAPFPYAFQALALLALMVKP